MLLKSEHSARMEPEKESEKVVADGLLAKIELKSVVSKYFCIGIYSGFLYICEDCERTGSTMKRIRSSPRTSPAAKRSRFSRVEDSDF